MAFTGTLDKCKACDKTVYVVDMMSLEGVPYHKSCFKCSHCKGTLSVYIIFIIFIITFFFLCILSFSLKKKQKFQDLDKFYDDI